MFNVQTIKNDILGGVTAAVVALPLALAFGVASGLGAVAGLYGAIVLGFFASLFGGTKTQISGPTGPMTVVMASSVVLFKGDVPSIMATVFLAGIIQISLGMIKVGKWIQYIPYPVVSGFMSGIGLIIIILQINPFLGVESIGSIIEVLYHLPKTLEAINIDALILASITLAIMFLTPKKIAKIVPPALIALVFMTIVSISFHFEVQTIGNIPTTLPNITLPSFDILQLKNIITMGITLALLGAIDTLLTSLVADSMTKTKHDSNKELIGQGIGNSLVSLVGGVPGAGATMRTVINIKSGGITRLSGMVHSLTLLVIVLFLAPLAAKIPLAVLSGILVKVGFDIFDYRFLSLLRMVPRTDLLIMVTVFLLTVFVDLIMAVGAGITFAALLAIYKISQNTKIITKVHKTYFDIDIDDITTKILKIDGALFFGTASILEKRISKFKRAKRVIIDVQEVHFLDISAIFILEDIVKYLQNKDIQVYLVLKEKHRRKILKVDSNNIFHPLKKFKSVEDAINDFQKTRIGSFE